MSNNKKLTQEMVYKWIGDDDKSEMAGYISGILNSIQKEGLSVIGPELLDEIYYYEDRDESDTKVLSDEMVLSWLGDDDKTEIAGYISGILNSLYTESKSEIAIDLFNEIYNYSVE